MDVLLASEPAASLLLLLDGEPVTGATIVLDVRREADGLVVDWDDIALKALGSVGTRHRAVPQVSAIDWPGLYRTLMALGDVTGLAEGDELAVTFYEVTAGPVYTPPP